MSFAQSTPRRSQRPSYPRPPDGTFRSG